MYDEELEAKKKEIESHYSRNFWKGFIAGAVISTSGAILWSVNEFKQNPYKNKPVVAAYQEAKNSLISLEEAKECVNKADDHALQSSSELPFRIAESTTKVSELSSKLDETIQDIMDDLEKISEHSYVHAYNEFEDKKNKYSLIGFIGAFSGVFLSGFLSLTQIVKREKKLQELRRK